MELSISQKLDIVDSFFEENGGEMDAIYDEYYENLASIVKDIFYDSFSSEKSMDGEAWDGHAPATTRWRRHYINKGSYNRMGSNVSVTTGDEGEMLVLSGMTRDEIGGSIYYNKITGDVILPDENNYSSILSGATSMIISSVGRPILSNDGDALIDEVDRDNEITFRANAEIKELFLFHRQNYIESYL